MNLELMKWGDGTIRLAFWNALNGDDKIFILEPSGVVFLSSYAEVEEDEELGEEIFTEVNLVTALIELAKKDAE